MAHQRDQLPSGEAWAVAERQHGAITRAQLLALGFSAEAIKGSDPEVSVPASLTRRRPGIAVHRRDALDAATTTVHLNIRVTRPARTILDLATTIPRRALEDASPKPTSTS
jgi:hypothetical protein